MSEEYYIRPPDSETARGPLNIEQLITLAEAGQVEAETLYYDERLESWVTIRSNNELKDQLFPGKRSLKLRNWKEGEHDSDGEEDPGGDISVEDMLAAAEGVTEETRHLRKAMEDRERAAALVLPLMGGVLLLSVFGIFYPVWDVMQKFFEGDSDLVEELIARPVLILGATDLLLAMLLFLGVSAVYPLVRFRALAGMGFFGLLWWAEGVNGDPLGYYKSLSAVALGIGLFGATLCSRTRSLLAVIGLAALGALAILVINSFLPLLSLWQPE